MVWDLYNVCMFITHYMTINAALWPVFDVWSFLSSWRSFPGDCVHTKLQLSKLDVFSPGQSCFKSFFSNSFPRQKACKWIDLRAHRERRHENSEVIFSQPLSRFVVLFFQNDLSTFETIIETTTETCLGTYWQYYWWSFTCHFPPHFNLSTAHDFPTLHFSMKHPSCETPPLSNLPSQKSSTK